MLFDQLWRVNAHVLHLQLGTMAAVAALLQHRLQGGIADWHGSCRARGWGRSGHHRRGTKPDDRADQNCNTDQRIADGVAVAAQLVAMAHHEKLADGGTGKHHQDQDDPVLRVAPCEAVMAAEHGEDHWQREVGVVHTALLAAFAVDRVHRLACLDLGHHGALTRDDQEEHVGTHGGGNHGAHQQEGSTASEQMACQPGSHAHQNEHASAHNGVAVLALAKRAADHVVQQPEDHQETQGRRNGHAGCPVHLGLVDQVGAGAVEIRDSEQRKACQPGAVAFPVEPMQVLGHFGRCAGKLDGVVKTAAVQCPQFA